MSFHSITMLFNTLRNPFVLHQKARKFAETKKQESVQGKVCVYLPSVHLPPPILYHLPHLFCVFCHAIFSTLAIRTSATPILKSESMQSIQQVGRRGHEGDDG